MIEVVSSDTALSFPQIIHPRASTFLPSAITISSEDNSYSESFNARNFSHSFAYLIVIFQSILSVSKQ